MNRLSGACFIGGVVLTTWFVANNLEKAQQVKDIKRGMAQDGITSPIMQKVSGATDTHKGLTSPAIAAKVTPATAAPAASPIPSAPAQINQAPKR
jgi:hypothetical protein